MGFTNLILFQRCFFLLRSLSFFRQLRPLPHFILFFPCLSNSSFLSSPLSPCLSASPCYFSLPPSLCITLSQPNGITGEHVSLSSFGLCDILTYHCEVNEMEYKNDLFLTYGIIPTPSLSKDLCSCVLAVQSP